MKKASYQSNGDRMLVEQVTTLDIHTGELSQMPVVVREKRSTFAYLFVQWQEKIGADPRMTGEAWTVLSKMMAHTEYLTNLVKLRLADIVAQTGMPQRSVSRAITTLRVVGALQPSQKHGEYHLSLQLMYKGNLAVRKRLLQQQERRT